MRGLSRRHLLAGTAVGLSGGVAGCLGSSDDDVPDETETESTTDDEGSVLGDIVLDNSSENDHVVDIIVEFDREIETWVTEELAGNESITLDREWPTDAGNVRVTARLDTGDPVEVTPERWNDPDCLDLFVRIDDTGTLTFLSGTNGDSCADDPDIDDAEAE